MSFVSIWYSWPIVLVTAPFSFGVSQRRNSPVVLGFGIVFEGFDKKRMKSSCGYVMFLVSTRIKQITYVWTAKSFSLFHISLHNDMWLWLHLKFSILSSVVVVFLALMKWSGSPRVSCCGSLPVLKLRVWLVVCVLSIVSVDQTSQLATEITIFSFEKRSSL